MHSLLKNLVIITALGSTMAFARANPPADLQSKLDAFVAGQNGGAVIAWVDRDGVAYFQAGRYSSDDPRVVTPDTPFEIGSITKVFTAILLAQSERAGKASRYDPAAKFLLPPHDPARPALAKITLLSLTTHTAGLPRLPRNFTTATKPDPYADYDDRMLVAALRSDGAEARVGVGVAYSNFGGAVLGEALAAAWGATYAEALGTHVLSPLGLNATSLGLAGAPPPTGLAPGHSGGKVVPNWTFQAFAPAGALRSTARDMAHFVSACLSSDGPLSAALTTTLAPQFPADEVGGHIGLGWFLTDDGFAWHNGATAGSHAFVAFNRKTGTGIAILANFQKGSEELGFGLLGAKRPAPKAVMVKNAADYVGRYPLSPVFAINVSEADGILHVQATGQPRLNLREMAADQFVVIGVPAEISFERDATGKVTALVLHQNGVDQRGPRGELPPPPKEITLPAETLGEYVGNYPLTPGFTLMVTEENGGLFVQATGQPKAQVFASAKDEFFYKVVDAQISFERDGSGKISGLILHQAGRDMPAKKTE